MECERLACCMRRLGVGGVSIRNAIVLRRVTGDPIINGFLLPRLHWVRRHEPEALARAQRLLPPKDYLRSRLTDELATEPIDAANTLLLDPLRCTWSEAQRSTAEVPSRLLPELVEGLAVAGHVTPEAARQTGLLSGTPVVAGGADMACSNAGTGRLEPGIVAVTLGMSGQVVTSSPAYTRRCSAR